MLTIIYRFITVDILALLVWNLFSEEKLAQQINCAIVLIPLVLRVLMIK